MTTPLDIFVSTNRADQARSKILLEATKAANVFLSATG